MFAFSSLPEVVRGMISPRMKTPGLRLPLAISFDLSSPLLDQEWSYNGHAMEMILLNHLDCCREPD